MAGKRILIVDDDPDFVQAMRLVLETQGYQVFHAFSGREALEKVADIKPDLILLDIIMESESAGFEMAYQLRNPAGDAPYVAFCAVPILMLTALGKVKQVSFTPESFLPVDEYLDKPVRPELLLERIAALLQAGGSRYKSADS